jgi:hypothetical protein
MQRSPGPCLKPFHKPHEIHLQGLLFEGNGGAARWVIRAAFDRWRLRATEQGDIGGLSVVVEPGDQAAIINSVNVLIVIRL